MLFLLTDCDESLRVLIQSHHVSVLEHYYVQGMIATKISGSYVELHANHKRIMYHGCTVAITHAYIGTLAPDNRYGSLGDTGPRELRKSATHWNKFEPGNEDVFTIEAVDLGVLERVVIGHDNRGLGASWYVPPTFFIC